MGRGPMLSQLGTLAVSSNIATITWQVNSYDGRFNGSLLRRDAEEKTLQVRVLDPRKYVHIEPRFGFSSDAIGPFSYFNKLPLEVSEIWIREFARKGRIYPARKVGRIWLFFRNSTVIRPPERWNRKPTKMKPPHEELTTRQLIQHMRDVIHREDR